MYGIYAIWIKNWQIRHSIGIVSQKYDFFCFLEWFWKVFESVLFCKWQMNNKKPCSVHTSFPMQYHLQWIWPVDEKSEQAMVQSAPPPLPFLSDLKTTAAFFPLTGNLSGPFFPQNLGNAKQLNVSTHNTILNSQSHYRLFYPCRISLP